MIGQHTHIVKISAKVISALCVCALISGCNNQHENADFISEVIASDFADVKFAELAINRSDNRDVRELAEMIDKEHEKLIKELKGFADMRGITIPLEENANARRKLNDLATTDDKAFDEKWCRELTNQHEKTIEKLEDMWEQTSDEELKKWINSALPGLRYDLVKLQTCHEKLTM
jgi:putative membrane protein